MSSPGSDATDGRADPNGGADLRPDEPGAEVSPAWADWRRSVSIEDYEARFARLAATGASVHGEADFVAALGPRRVLDAGCGTGRMAIELDLRGFDVVGVDLDDDMLAAARAKPSGVRWVRADLASMELGERFPLVVMAGNVMLFCRVGERAAVVAGLARHLDREGLLVAGYSLRPEGPTVMEYDRFCADAGLELVERYAGWAGEPFAATSDYQLSLHRLVG
jgi:SAM-dependent methyltransferase